MRSERLASAVGLSLIALVACQKTPKGADSGVEAPTSTTTSSPTPNGPSSPGQRNARASSVIARCKTPPPNECETDADCALFDIPTNDNPCASTLQAGVRADRKASYVASTPCAAPAQLRPSPPCVVHWVRAEEGPDTPPSGTEIRAYCAKPAGSPRGACLTHYAPASH